jgi:hypothetical protein
MLGGSRCRLVVLLATLLLPRVSAWGKMGHELVGNLAWDLLPAAVQVPLAELLNVTTPATTADLTSKDDSLVLTPLGAVADWADVVRHTHAYSWSAPLHYIDVRDDVLPAACSDDPDAAPSCAFQWTRDCPDGVCVAGAIQNYTARWSSRQTSHPGSTDTSSSSRAEALKFLTHFVGDLHQPLHVSRTTDKGGNNIAVRVNFTASPTTTSSATSGRSSSSLRGSDVHHHGLNLHAVWDDTLLETYCHEKCQGDWTCFQEHLQEYLAAARRLGVYDVWTRCGDGARQLCVDIWAQESWRLAQTMAYRDAQDEEIISGAILSRSYYDTRIPVVLEQLCKAAARLASTLEAHAGDGASSSSSTLQGMGATW